MSGKERRDYRSLGEILSDARRERDFTVQQVSEKTKIAPRMIVSFENDELDNLSGPVYARGFLRSLCELYGLDRSWMMSKLEAGMETADPVPAELVPPSPAPKIESAQTEDDETAADSPTGPSEQTWKIEKVDNARVRRIRPQARRKIPGRLLGALVLIVLLVLLVLFGRSLFWDDSTASDMSLQASPPRHEEARSQEQVDAEDPKASQEERTATTVESSPEERTPTAAEPPPEIEDEPSPDSGPESGSSPAVERSSPAAEQRVRSAGTEDGQQERVLYRDVDSEGLTSIVRRGPDAKLPTMTLRVEALRTVELRVVVDEGQRHERLLRAGESWVVEGRESFSLQLSDDEAAIVELDGIRREPPPGLETPWVLQANTVSSGAN